ncbi:MAG: tetratricopeptide repeat protein [Hyphomicrobiales bacterium]
MNWSDIKQALAGAVAKLKSSNFMDAAVGELLDQVPFVGGFAGRYWSNLGDDDKAEAESLARFLETIGERETRFIEMQAFLRSQSSATIDLVLKSKGSLDMLLAVVERVDGGLSDLKDQVSGLSIQMAEVAEVTGKKFVGNALRASATLIDDHKSRSDIIGSITRDLEQAGRPVTGEALYDMAMMFMLADRYELAEAALLELHHRDGARDDALIALGHIYQLRAHEHIIKKNFGFAEEILEKSRAYIKLSDDDDNLDIDLQLAYSYKELGQAYMQAARPGEATKPLRVARKLFAGVLELEPKDPSALSGMGSICIVQGDYEEAIPYIQGAIDLSPTYVAAWYDLAQASYALMRRKRQSGDGDGATRLLKVGLTAYHGVQTLRENGILLPETAQQHLDRLYQPMLASG